MKCEWHFKATKYTDYDSQGEIVVDYTDEKGQVIRAVYCKANKEPLCLNGHGGESGSELYFYVLDECCKDSLDDVIKYDLDFNYLEVVDQLDLYTHYPTFDDSRAGQIFCTGESISMFGEWLVLDRGFAYDI